MNRDAALTLASQCFVVLCGLATSIITARLLGPEGRGDYFVVVTFASLLVQFGNLGIHSSNTYLAARDASLVRGLTANSLWLASAAGMAALAILLAGPLTGWPPEGREADYWLGCALVPPTLFCLLGGSLLVGGQRFARFNAFQIGSHLLVLVALASAAACRMGITGVLCASASAWWCCAVVLYVLIARTSGGSWRFDPRLLWEGVGFAGKAYLSCLVGYLLARANVLLLDHLQNPRQIGYYSVAVQVADAMCLLPGSVGLVLFPRLVRQQHSRWETSLRLLVRVGLLMGGACLVAGVAIDPFVRLAFGHRFLPAVPVVQWMLPGILCYSLVSILSQYLAAIGFPAAVVGIWLSALGVLGAVSWALIPNYGAVGAAISLSAANATVLVLQLALAISLQPGATEAMVAGRTQVSS